MIILAIILIIICATKLCLLGSGTVEADCDSLPVSKKTITSLAKGVIVLESLVGILCGLFIIFAL